MWRSFLPRETTRQQGLGSNHRPPDRKSNALTTRQPRLNRGEGGGGDRLIVIEVVSLDINYLKNIAFLFFVCAYFVYRAQRKPSFRPPLSHKAWFSLAAQVQA